MTKPQSAERELMEISSSLKFSLDADMDVEKCEKSLDFSDFKTKGNEPAVNEIKGHFGCHCKYKTCAGVISGRRSKDTKVQQVQSPCG